MAKLTAEQRKKLPKSSFAVPGKAPASGSYPVNDRNHAKAALSMSARHGTPAEKAAVKAKVKGKFPGMLKDKAKGKSPFIANRKR
jgi:hypothetical protein